MEYMKGEGDLLTYEFCTAASNIAAGTPVALLTGSSVVYTLGRTVVGFKCTALLGYHFIGILAEDISAGECPVTVWTEGVFKLQTSSASTSAGLAPGWPVWADSGMVVVPGVGQTSDVPMGTVINRPAECTGSATLHVRINPAIYRWSTWVGAAFGGAYVTGTQAAPFSFPKTKGHA